jgi:hypothetical protein
MIRSCRTSSPSVLSSNPKLLAESEVLCKIFRDDDRWQAAVYETNQAKKIEREAKAKELPADAQSVQYTAQQRAIAADPNADPAARAEAQLFVDEDDKRRVRSGQKITSFGPDGNPIVNDREWWIRREGSGFRSGGRYNFDTSTGGETASQWCRWVGGTWQGHNTHEGESFRHWADRNSA